MNIIEHLRREVAELRRHAHREGDGELRPEQRRPRDGDRPREAGPRDGEVRRDGEARREEGPRDGERRHGHEFVPPRDGRPGLREPAPPHPAVLQLLREMRRDVDELRRALNERRGAEEKDVQDVQDVEEAK